MSDERHNLEAIKAERFGESPRAYLATNAQLHRISKAQGLAGLSFDDMDQAMDTRFGHHNRYALTREQASQFITDLEKFFSSVREKP